MNGPSPRGPRRVLAVDFGDARTGLAATDATGTLALPLEILRERDLRTLADRIAAVASDRESELILVGLPLAPDGGLGARGTRTREFARLLAKTVAPIPVAGMDERFTSHAAHQRLKEAGMKAGARRRRGVDAVAALLLVESWLAGAVTLEI